MKKMLAEFPTKIDLVAAILSSIYLHFYTLVMPRKSLHFLKLQFFWVELLHVQHSGLKMNACMQIFVPNKTWQEQLLHNGLIYLAMEFIIAWVQIICLLVVKNLGS